MEITVGETIALDGETLTTDKLYILGKHMDNVQIALSAEAKQRVDAGREVVDRIVAKGDVVYGINTGFGLFSNVTVSADKLCALQENLSARHRAFCMTSAPIP